MTVVVAGYNFYWLMINKQLLLIILSFLIFKNSISLISNCVFKVAKFKTKAKGLALCSPCAFLMVMLSVCFSRFERNVECLFCWVNVGMGRALSHLRIGPGFILAPSTHLSHCRCNASLLYGTIWALHCCTSVELLHLVRAQSQVLP